MSDIVERLRQQATIEAKKFGDSADIQLEWKAADEITRLRADLLEQASLLGMGAEREEKLLARVEVLERVREAALPHLFTPSMETGIALLKAVQEAKP